MRKFLHILIITAITMTVVSTARSIRLSIVDSTYKKESYRLTEAEATASLNSESFDYLIRYSDGTTSLVSPLAYQTAMVNYLVDTNSKSDEIFHLLRNGVWDFEQSVNRSDNRAVEYFTAGISQSSLITSINADVTDKLVVDEINATINTLSNGSVSKDLVQENLNSMNIFAITSVVESLRTPVMAYSDYYIVSAKLRHIAMDDFYLVELPLTNNYTLVMMNGNLSKFKGDLGLYYTTDDITIKIPHLNLEVFGNPVSALLAGGHEGLLQEFPELKTLYAINHLSLSYNVVDELDHVAMYNLDFTKNSKYIIIDNMTGEFVLLGSVL